MDGGHIQSGGQYQGFRTGETLSYWRTLPGYQREGDTARGSEKGRPSKMGTLPAHHRSGTHPEWGTFCSIREEYRERTPKLLKLGSIPKLGTLRRGRDGVHIQSEGHRQGIKT